MPRCAAQPIFYAMESAESAGARKWLINLQNVQALCAVLSPALATLARFSSAHNPRYHFFACVHDRSSMESNVASFGAVQGIQVLFAFSCAIMCFNVPFTLRAFT